MEFLIASWIWFYSFSQTLAHEDTDKVTILEITM